MSRLFGFVNDWRRRLIDEPLNARLEETLRIGLAVARNEVHVVTGYLQSSIGGDYDRSTRTIRLHADAPYALIEETRPPLGAHSYLAPAANEMAHFWGGASFELHYPNAYEARGVAATTRQIHAITNYHRSMGRRLASRTRVIVRRHRRLALIPTDPTTPLL